MQNLLMMVVRGVAIGAIISAPMGPVGILCVQRTLDGGRRHGFYTGIGASLSDLFYCLLTGFGLSFIEGFLQDNQQIIQILGSIVLIGFGIYIMKKNPARTLSRPPVTAARNGKDVLSGFLFTFSNPLILFLIIGLFARFNFQSPDYRWFHYVVGYISIVAGAVGWWWLITSIVNKVRAHFNLRSMWIVNRVIGIIILIFALFGIISAFTAKSNAMTKPAERILLHQQSHTAPEPLPIIIEAPGPEAGRFSFLRSLPPEDEITGIEFVVTNRHSSPTTGYPALDSDGKTIKVKRPQINLIWRDSLGYEGNLTLTSAEGAGYDSEESGGETRLRLSPLNKKLKPLPFPIDKTPFHIDLTPKSIEIKIGSGESVIAPLYAPLVGFDIEVSPGGEIILEDARIWSVPRPKFNREIMGLDWSSDNSASTSLSSITEKRKMEAVCGLWMLYDSREDNNYMRRGGNYRILILPSEKGEELLDIWMIDGAETLSEEWPTGRLKGRLKKTGYSDDWELDWYDSEGHWCGPYSRAHLNSDNLSFLFPRHNSSILFVRP